MQMNKKCNSGLNQGFSLIELMVAMGILSVLMLMLTALLDQVQRSWRFSESRISQFREARVAFDLITKNLGQASLNNYWEVKDDDKDGIYDGYYRTSELHFATMEAKELGQVGTQAPVGQAVFFQAPLGFSSQYRNLNNLFNGRGYFVAFGGDKRFRPSFVESEERYRYRLMEFRPPAEGNQIFQDGQEERDLQRPQVFTQWFKQDLPIGEGNFESHLNPLAENIIFLVVSPRDSLPESGSRDDTFSDIAPNYKFNSNNTEKNFQEFAQQLPPLVRVTMIAIDETAAVRLEESSGEPSKIKGALENRFQDTRKFAEDVQSVTDALNELNVSHKIFSSMVMLRGSKWSS